MRKSKAKRLDYKVYAKTGVKIYKASEVSEASASIQEEGQSSIIINQKMEEYTEIIMDQQVISEDIADYIEENPLEDMSAGEIDEKITRIEQMRTSYRTKHAALKLLMEKEYENNFAKEYQARLGSIKTYILEAKKIKKMMNQNQVIEEKSKEESKKISGKFLIREIRKIMASLEVEFVVDLSESCDEELLKKKKEVTEISKKMESLSTKVKEMLSCLKLMILSFASM